MSEPTRDAGPRHRAHTAARDEAAAVRGEGDLLSDVWTSEGALSPTSHATDLPCTLE